jgi:hypothetical protein
MTPGRYYSKQSFSGWDRDKIAVACSPYILQDNIDTEICDTYYQLGRKEGKWRFPLIYSTENILRDHKIYQRKNSIAV